MTTSEPEHVAEKSFRCERPPRPEAVKPGVWRSDVEGHLLVLALDPLVVTCVACLEACRPSDYKFDSGFAAAAQAFVAKHGALHERLADSVMRLVPPRAAK